MDIDKKFNLRKESIDYFLNMHAKYLVGLAWTEDPLLMKLYSSEYTLNRRM